MMASDLEKVELDKPGSFNELDKLPSLSHHEMLEDNASERRRISLKLDLRVLPMLTVLWLLAFIDRANVGNAKVAGMETDLGLEGLQFNVALSVFFISYIMVEIPSNLALKRIGAHIWLPCLVICWGAVTMSSTAISSYGGLLAVRVCLGAAEGGVLPGIIYYLASLYPRYEVTTRIGWFFAATAIAGSCGGLLASAILHMNGLAGLAGWRYVFLLEGGATVLAGFVAFFILPRDLQSAKFLTPAQRELAVRRLCEVGAARPEQFEWYELRRALKEPQVWLTGLGYCCVCTSIYSLSFFLPSILVSLGYEGTDLQLHTVPVYVPAAVMTVVIALLADKTKRRGVYILALLPVSMIGYILLIIFRDNYVRYAAVFLVALGVYPAGPCILSWLSGNVAGYTKRATCCALQLMLCNLSGVGPATFLYESRFAPHYVPAHAAVLGILVLGWCSFALNLLYCRRENRLRLVGRRDDNIEQYHSLLASGKTLAPLGDRDPAFLLSFVHVEPSIMTTPSPVPSTSSSMNEEPVKLWSGMSPPVSDADMARRYHESLYRLTSQQWQLTRKEIEKKLRLVAEEHGRQEKVATYQDEHWRSLNA